MQSAPVDQKKWELVPFSDHPQHDSMWAMVCGTDGHIYVGLCCEHTGGGIAQLYRYNVKKRKLEHCADMAQVTGEPAAGGHAAQGKIHFSLCPTSDGLLYGTTHATTPPLDDKVWSPYGTWGDPVKSYPGGHLFRYDPRTGETLDFGILYPHDGLPFLLLDEKRKRFYGITYPKAHFFSANMAGRDVTDYGRVSSWYPIGMTFDAKGNLFFGDTNAGLIKYDVQQDKLIFFQSRPYANPWNASRRFSWLCNLTLVEDGKIYGTNYCNDHFFRFDPNEAAPQIEDLGPGLAGPASGIVRGLVPDGKGHIYYVFFREGWSSNGEGCIFIRYTIRTGKKEALGGLRVNGIAFGSWLAVKDLDGNIYMKGGGKPLTLAIYRPNK